MATAEPPWRVKGALIRRTDECALPGAERPTAEAAYRAGEKITDERTGLVYDYRKKGGVDATALLVPEQAPAELRDRATLWNAVERIEKRKDAQLAREIDVALPRELNTTEPPRRASGPDALSNTSSQGRDCPASHRRTASMVTSRSELSRFGSRAASANAA